VVGLSRGGSAGGGLSGQCPGLRVRV
jgi:hypothetical protein